MLLDKRLLLLFQIFHTVLSTQNGIPKCSTPIQNAQVEVVKDRIRCTEGSSKDWPIDSIQEDLSTINCMDHAQILIGRPIKSHSQMSDDHVNDPSTHHYTLQNKPESIQSIKFDPLSQIDPKGVSFLDRYFLALVIAALDLFSILGKKTNRRTFPLLVTLSLIVLVLPAQSNARWLFFGSAQDEVPVTSSEPTKSDSDGETAQPSQESPSEPIKAPINLDNSNLSSSPGLAKFIQQFNSTELVNIDSNQIFETRLLEQAEQNNSVLLYNGTNHAKELDLALTEILEEHHPLLNTDENSTETLGLAIAPANLMKKRDPQQILLIRARNISLSNSSASLTSGVEVTTATPPAQSSSFLSFYFGGYASSAMKTVLFKVGNYLPIKGVASIAADLGIPGGEYVMEALSSPTTTESPTYSVQTIPASRTATSGINPKFSAWARSDTLVETQPIPMPQEPSYKEELSSIMGTMYGEKECMMKLACLSGKRLSNVRGVSSLAMFLSTVAGVMPDGFQDPYSAMKNSILYTDDCSQYQCKDDINVEL